jgi:hypothetical protein
MLSLNSTTDTTTDVDYNTMEAFYLHHVLPALAVEFFMDSNFQFNERFLTFLSNHSGLSGKMIWSVLNNIRKPVYSESLKTLNEMILDQVDIADRDDILDDEFAEKIENMIIRSKHNGQVRKIADAAWALVERIFSDNGSDLPSYHSVRKCQIKNAVVYILLVVMQVYLKHHQKQTFAV